MIIMDTNHSTTRAGIGIFTNSNTAIIILAFRCTKSKIIIKSNSHISNCSLLANSYTVALINITIDICLAAYGHIACTKSIIPGSIALNDNIITDSNTFI